MRILIKSRFYLLFSRDFYYYFCSFSFFALDIYTTIISIKYFFCNRKSEVLFLPFPLFLLYLLCKIFQKFYSNLLLVFQYHYLLFLYTHHYIQILHIFLYFRLLRVYLILFVSIFKITLSISSLSAYTSGTFAVTKHSTV